MPTHSKRLTDTEARKIAPPASSYAIHWCPSTPGFGLRVTHTGARAWIVERRVDGKTVRRTLGGAAGRGAISAEAARALLLETSSSLQRGVDPLAVKKARRVAEKAEAVSFGDALREYVRTKRRAKDGLPLKERTRADYLAMIEPGRPKKDGAPTLDGELRSIADRPLTKITAEAIRTLHASLQGRGERRQGYAMQVLRAVLRHHGARIEGNPLDTATAGKDRVRIAPSRGKPAPIPPERIGAWWRAACDIQTVNADSLRFALLTGCRPGEVAALRVDDVDLTGGRVRLLDTKNRQDHVVLLSKQAHAVVAAHMHDRAAGSLVFGVKDAGKTLARINATAGTPGVTQHRLRHSFASIAEELVPHHAVKAMLNHTPAGDVTLAHYVKAGEAQLRAAWQTVADFIEGQADALHMVQP